MTGPRDGKATLPPPGATPPGTPESAAAARARHRAARIEDAVQRFVARPLRRRGWGPEVIAYTGYGGPGWVRVFTRVLLAPPGGWRGRGAAARGWRNFVTLPAPGTSVHFDVAGRRHRATCDRGGYVDAVVPAALEPGWHEVPVAVAGSPPVSAAVRVVGADTAVGLVSDIDDTAMVTSLPRPLLAFWNTFVVHEHARRSVPGMAALYRQFLDEHPGAPVVYLSTGAWNVAVTLGRFLDRHGFPPGPLLLTDWGPTDTGWFRDGRAHKRAALHRLTTEFPQVRWLLVGDDGQHDPEIYGEHTRAAPGHVLAVAIRHLSPTQQVLARGIVPVDPHADHGPEVPWVVAPDGWGLAARLRARGLL